MTKGKKTILSIALFVAAFFCTTVSAHAATYYFNNAVNTSPTTLGNYWTNVGLTVQATALPDVTKDEVIVVSGATFNGDAIFNGNGVNNGTIIGNAKFNNLSLNEGTVIGDAQLYYSAYNNGVIQGTATFNDYTTNTSGAEVIGTAIFYDNTINDGTITGNASFYDGATNNGTITGNATFYGDLSAHYGSAGGTKTRYYTADTIAYGDYVSDGPWIIVADGVVVDITSVSDNTTTIYSPVNGGSFVYDDTPATATYYFNNAIDTSPTTLGNYWNNSGLTQHASHLPDFSTDAVNVVSGATFNGNPTFNGSAENRGTVSGNAVFNNAAANYGTVTGNATFNNSASNSGVVSGTAIFNATSSNGSNGTVSGNATFNTSAINVGTINATTVTFNGNTINDGTVSHDAIFNATSRNRSGTISGIATFNDSTLNQGTIPGSAIFNGESSENQGTVTGTKTRRYTTSITTTRNFVSTGPWTVLADGVVVDATGATSNGTTTFSTLNSGYFTDTTLSSASIQGKTLMLTYNTSLDTGSVPATSDFIVTINGISTGTISSVQITGATAVITLSQVISINDAVTISYTKGTNPLRSSLSHNVVNLYDATVTVAQTTIPTGGFPRQVQIALVNNRIYVLNGEQSDTDSGNSVFVLDALTGSLITTISVGNGVTSIVAVGNKVYVSNDDDSTISVINTNTNTVSSTISVPSSAFYMIASGSKIYTTNYGGTNTMFCH